MPLTRWLARWAWQTSPGNHEAIDPLDTAPKGHEGDEPSLYRCGSTHRQAHVHCGADSWLVV
jgi:hypothetical protein